ncbi:hypothetical protein LCGC14_2146030, partial [marine sediment metagenome]
RRSIEAVAILNWRLFPTKFSMVGFSQFPDAFRTNRSLLQGQPKYRNWLTGSAKKGYSLNERGIGTAQRLIELLGPPQLDDGTALGSSADSQAKAGKPTRTIEPSTIVKRIRSSRLFAKWASDTVTERDTIHAHSLLGVFDHTPARVRVRKMKELERCAEDLDDQEVMRFLKHVREEFPSVFRD